jgi:hypothetical protein
VTTVLLWLAERLAAAAAGWAAGYFSNPVCPSDPASFICGHWDVSVSVASAVLGVFGYHVTRAKLAASRAAQRVEVEPPPPETPAVAEVSVPARDDIDWSNSA